MDATHLLNSAGPSICESIHVCTEERVYAVSTANVRLSQDGCPQGAPVLSNKTGTETYSGT